MLKKDRRIVEYERDKWITDRKLAEMGITEETMQEFCDDVAAFVPDGKFFTIQSLKKDGFSSSLFDTDFGDVFFASILREDDRFKTETVYDTPVAIKNAPTANTRAFFESIVRAHGTISREDLWREVTERYGCHISDATKASFRFCLTELNLYYDRVTGMLSVNPPKYPEADIEEDMSDLDETEISTREVISHLLP